MPIVELLGVDAGIVTSPKRTVTLPVIFLTIRPEPHRSWESVRVALSWEQAERLSADIAQLKGYFRNWG